MAALHSEAGEANGKRPAAQRLVPILLRKRRTPLTARARGRASARPPFFVVLPERKNIMPIFIRFLLGVACLAAGCALVVFSAHGAYLVAVAKVGHGLPYTFGCIVGVMMIGGAWDLFQGAACAGRAGQRRHCKIGLGHAGARRSRRHRRDGQARARRRRAISRLLRGRRRAGARPVQRPETYPLFRPARRIKIHGPGRPESGASAAVDDRD
jgi:hypothetical protein